MKVTINDTDPGTTIVVEGYEGYVHLTTDDNNNLTLTPEAAGALAAVLDHFASEPA